ncbi:MAG: host attachment protein [Hyphomicrobium sp.]
MKRLKTGDWVVVADGARGLVLVNTGTALEPELSTVRTYGQDNPKTSELGRDKPTRTFESVGTRRSAAEVPDLHQRAEDRFVGEIIAELTKDASDKAFDKVVIVAPPVALGEMRKVASEGLAAKVSAWIDKDLTKEPITSITKAVVRELEG